MEINEVAPPTKKHERMVKHIKKSYAKKGGLSDEEKSIAYATAWKNYKKNESFEIDPQKHRKAKRDAKIRNLAKDNKNPNEKSAAERKLKGPKLAWEEFKSISEATKAECEKKRRARENADDYVCRNIGGGNWSTKKRKSLQGQQKKRSESLKPIKKKELEDHGKRNLHKNWKETAKSAMKSEVAKKKSQRAEAQKKSKETGKQHDVDHVQAQPNRKKHSARWQKIHPGDASGNRRVIPQSDNLKKNSKDSGEKKKTRSSMVKSLIDTIRNKKKEEN